MREFDGDDYAWIDECESDSRIDRRNYDDLLDENARLLDIIKDLTDENKRLKDILRQIPCLSEGKINPNSIVVNQYENMEDPREKLYNIRFRIRED